MSGPERPGALLVATFLGAAILLTVSGSAAAAEAADRPLPHFHEVSEGLYRGAAPRAGGVRELARLGIRTIVDLRSGNEAAGERDEAAAAGLRHVHLPLGGFRRPVDEEIERILSLLAAPENRPVFVHCRRGRDRTGLVIACYRMRYEGWTAERALEEARRYGLAWWEFRMKGYIEDGCGAAGPGFAVEAAP